KNLPGNKLCSTFWIRFFMDNVAAFMFLLKGNTQDFKAVYKAWNAFRKNYASVKAKRDDTAHSAYADLFPKSIVFQHYLRGMKKFDGKKLLK
ncbi:MAG: glycosyltransferase family 2 protein, partial [Bacteroidales bacterium]|nr:glycosyltransferase family 2 protein [Bacteroidales bacterium]